MKITCNFEELLVLGRLFSVQGNKAAFGCATVVYVSHICEQNKTAIKHSKETMCWAWK